jgi:hypothetical protein
MTASARRIKALLTALALAALAITPVAGDAKQVKPPRAKPPFPQPQPKDAAARRALALQRAAVELINLAQTHVRATVPGCRPARPPATTFTHDPPSQDALNTIGLLRRPATAADRLDESKLAHFPAQDLYIDYVRAAHTASGRKLYIAVARNTNLTSLFEPQPAKCLAAAHTQLVHLLAHQPRKVRSEALKIFGQLRAGRERQPTAPYEGVFILSAGPNSGISGGGGGGSLANFAQHGAFLSIGKGARSQLLGLVPDGVASITFEYPKTVSRGPYFKPARYPSAVSRTVAVRDNAVALTVPRPPQDAFTRMVWRAADGHVLRVDTHR